MIARLYAYMHDIFGAEVIELFDMEYNPEEKYAKKQDDGPEAKADAKPDGRSALEEGTDVSGGSTVGQRK